MSLGFGDLESKATHRESVVEVDGACADKEAKAAQNNNAKDIFRHISTHLSSGLSFWSVSLFSFFGPPRLQGIGIEKVDKLCCAGIDDALRPE